MNSGKTRPIKARIELTHRATNDLREIESYSNREWGRKTANKYLDEIAAALDRLSENPELLRLEPAFSQVCSSIASRDTSWFAIFTVRPFLS